MSSTSSTQTASLWQGSSIDAGNLSISGQNTTIEGSDITASWLKLDSDNVLITAGVNQYKEETSSSTKSVSASGGSNGSASASASVSSSKSSSTSLENVNSRINVGHLESDADSLTLRGAEVTTQTADLNVGSLTVQSLQDTSESSNSSKSTSVGVSNSTSKNGSSQSANVGVNRSSGSSEAQEVGNQTQLLITDGAKSQITAKDTTLIGGLIANATRNEDGTLTDHGQLNLTTETLTVADLQDKSESEQSGWGFQTSTGRSADKKGENVSYGGSGTTTVSMSNEGHKKEGETQATLGLGNIKVGGTALGDQEQYASLNRDVNEGQITTLDQQTGGLNTSLTMDNRWLTEEGRKMMEAEHKKLAADVVTGAAQVGAAVTAAVTDSGQIGNAWDTVGKGQDLAYANDGQTAAKIEAVSDGEVKAGQTAQTIVGEMVGTLNPDGTQKVRVTEGMNAYGAYNKNGDTIYVEVSAETRGSIVNTAAHEVMHAKGANETTATVTGYMTDLAYQVNAWANSDQIDNARSQMVFAPANAAADKELLDKNNAAFTGDAERGELEYRVLPKKEKEQAKDIADKSGQYSVEQIEEQMRLMGNKQSGEKPNTVAVLTTQEQIQNFAEQDPNMPITVYGPAIVEVPGKADANIQKYIIDQTTVGGGEVPEWSPYVESDMNQNGPKLSHGPVNAPTAACANGDTVCSSGVGAQQNKPLTRDDVADWAQDTSRNAGVVAAAATAATAVSPPQAKPIPAAVAIGATVVGVVADGIEQVARPNLGAAAVNTVGLVIQTGMESLPAGRVMAPMTNEIIEYGKKSKEAQSFEQWINTQTGFEKP